jgi:hypothetical protein
LIGNCSLNEQFDDGVNRITFVVRSRHMKSSHVWTPAQDAEVLSETGGIPSEWVLVAIIFSVLLSTVWLIRYVYEILMLL